MDPLAGTFDKPTIEATEVWFEELVRCEAESVVQILAAPGGRAAWAGFSAAYSTTHRRLPPEAAQVVTVARRLMAARATQGAMARALSALEPPVLRPHRSAFLRFVEATDSGLPTEARAASARAAAVRVRLMKDCVPLVFWVANRYRYGLHGLALRRAGVAGLIDAVDGFEPERGHRFFTYARWWILARISRIGGMTKPVHRSGMQGEQLMRLGRAREEHWRTHGRAPGWDDLLAAVPGESSDVVWRRAVLSARHFDHPLGAVHPDGGTLLDHLVETERPDSDRDELLAQLWRLYLAVEPDFKKHRADTLRARFGLDGTPRRTFSEIGDQLGLSRERIRQIEHEALLIIAQRRRAEPD